MNKIYSIEYDDKNYIDTLNMDKLTREILNEYGNKEIIKAIAHTNNKFIFFTNLKEPKKMRMENYQPEITITFYDDFKPKK